MKDKRIVIGCTVAAVSLLLSLSWRAGWQPKTTGGRSLISRQNEKMPAGLPSATTPLPSPVGAEQRVINDETGFRAWLRERNGSRSMAADDLTRGAKLAVARREQMLHWFKTDPARAFAESLSWSEWRALPDEVRALVDEPFSAIVDFAVLPNCPPADASLPRIHPHQVLLNGEWHEAYVFGKKATITSKDGMPVRGIRLDGKVVLGEEAVERLSDEDRQAVADLFVAGGAARVAGSRLQINGPSRTILLGGTIYDFRSEAEAAALSDVIAAAEKSLHPKAVVMAMSVAGAGAGTIAFDLEAAEDGILRANSTWTETPKNTLAVRINYSDAAAYSYTPQEMTNLMNNASNAVKVMSYGKTRLMPRVASVTLPKTRAAYQTGGANLIATDTRTALNAIGINRDNYHIVVHAHPQMNFSYAGLGVIGGANNWLNGNVSLEVTVHELGHNYGLGHAHFWAGVTGTGNLGRDQAGDPVEKEEYGDPFDIMGGSSLPEGQFNAHGKAALNWIEQKEVINVVTNGIYRVYRYDHADARTNAGTKLALKISSPSGEEYWISHRRLFTSNPYLLRGASIVRKDGAGDQSLIDTTPLSRPSTAFSSDKNDAALPIGRTFSDPLGTIRVTTIAAGGTAPQEFIDVQVTFLDEGAFGFYTGADLRTNGLVGSYVNSSLRGRTVQDDWRASGAVVIAGRRIDRSLNFTSDGWGARAPLRLTGGTDANWENFSVQWDGYIVVRRPVRLATTSDDSSRFWIDLNRNGAFGTSAPEFVNNHWGSGQGPTRGDLSPIILPGTYRIRIQYEEGNGGNYFTIGGTDIPFEVFTDEQGTTPGLTGSYVARSLRTATAQSDWRVAQAVAGTRIDSYPGFTANSWGTLGSAGLSAGVNGSDSDWENFSVQWDGFLKVSVPLRMATISDDHSRMWIDLNTNGTFAATAPELINNGWGGGGQGTTLGQLSVVIQPGTYPIRIQYEEGGGGNYFLLAGVPQSPAEAPSLLNGHFFSGAGSRTTPHRIPGDFTIQFWLKSGQIAGGETTWTDGMGLVDGSVAAGPGFGVSLGNGKILFGAGDSLSDSTTLRSEFVADDQWHHVSARRIQSSGEITLFVDGLEMGRSFGGTNRFEGLTDLTIGGLNSGINFYTGFFDQFKLWDTARTDEQIIADYHQARSTHEYTDLPPEVRLTAGENSVQVFWDPLSGYRKLEGATTLDGAFVPLATDQNSTNIPMQQNSTRFFRVRR